jgi:hypothetical protein
MINPNDIFNAHRVVKSPTSFRRRGGGPLPLLPMVGLPTITDGQRRRAALRTVTASIGARVRSARSVTVRTILPAIRKR